MKLTFSWLNEHIKLRKNPEQVSEDLTSLGLEVESIENTNIQYKNFYICKIVKAFKHPNADRLKICEVSDGIKTYKVVCGAENAIVGLKTILAHNGTYIPGTNFKLEKKNIRGIEGDGMLCSEAELGLPEKKDGIIELGEEYTVGKTLAEYFKDDYIFNIGLTPNRGDCASVRGIARDLGAKLNLNLIKREINNNEGIFKSSIKWNLKDLESKDDCPIIYGRHFKIKNNLSSPYWLSSKLKSIGLKPISSLVDITNFILYDIGRPLHVFDVEKLEGDLNVTSLNAEETFLGLDKKEYKLKKGDIVIKDRKKIVSIAGIMGGLNSCVDKNTKEVFLEVAYFCPKKIAQTGRRLGIVSDARYRFERGIDSNGLLEGLELSTKFIVDTCGGTFSSYTSAGKPIIAKNTIRYDFDFFDDLVGYHLSPTKQEDILKKLNFRIIKKDKKSLLLSPPSWRNDINISNDIVEEILRLDGYYNIPEEQLKSEINIKKNIFSNSKDTQFNIRESLAKLGLFEVITYSFMSEKKVVPNDKVNHKLKLENPISSELGIMRNSLLPNLLDIASKNYSKGINSTEIFEVGYVYSGLEISDQISNFAILLSGNISKKTWHYPSRSYDFFDMKAILLSLLEEFSVREVKFQRSKNEWFHPGISSDVMYKGKKLFSFGELHPNLKTLFKIKNSCIICEGSLEDTFNVYKQRDIRKPLLLSPLLPLKKDFSFILNSQISVQELIDAIKEVDEKVSEITVFDVYKNSNSEDVSIGVEVEIIQKEKVLDSKEINSLMSKIILKVEKKVGAKLRPN